MNLFFRPALHLPRRRVFPDERKATFDFLQRLHIYTLPRLVRLVPFSLVLILTFEQATSPSVYCYSLISRETIIFRPRHL